jgi:hypothetical protein
MQSISPERGDGFMSSALPLPFISMSLSQSSSRSKKNCAEGDGADTERAAI